MQCCQCCVCVLAKGIIYGYPYQYGQYITIVTKIYVRARAGCLRSGKRTDMARGVLNHQEQIQSKTQKTAHFYIDIYTGGTHSALASTSTWFWEKKLIHNTSTSTLQQPRTHAHIKLKYSILLLHYCAKSKKTPFFMFKKP